MRISLIIITIDYFYWIYFLVEEYNMKKIYEYECEFLDLPDLSLSEVEICQKIEEKYPLEMFEKYLDYHNFTHRESDRQKCYKNPSWTLYIRYLNQEENMLRFFLTFKAPSKGRYLCTVSCGKIKISIGSKSKG